MGSLHHGGGNLWVVEPGKHFSSQFCVDMVPKDSHLKQNVANEL